MIGERAAGEGAAGTLSAEPVRLTVGASGMRMASARARIEGAAFRNLLGSASARREYLVALYPLKLG